MTRRECDRCGKMLPRESPLSQFVPPKIKVCIPCKDYTACFPQTLDQPVDLCDACEKAVYDFIFCSKEKAE